MLVQPSGITLLCTRDIQRPPSLSRHSSQFRATLYRVRRYFVAQYPDSQGVVISMLLNSVVQYSIQGAEAVARLLSVERQNVKISARPAPGIGKNMKGKKSCILINQSLSREEDGRILLL